MTMEHVLRCVSKHVTRIRIIANRLPSVKLFQSVRPYSSHSVFENSRLFPSSIFLSGVGCYSLYQIYDRKDVDDLEQFLCSIFKPIRAKAASLMLQNRDAQLAAIPQLAKQVAPSIGCIQTSVGLVSGVVVDSSGYIVTSTDYLDHKTELPVYFDGGKVFNAKVVAIDEAKNLALLKMDVGWSKVPALPLASNTTPLRVGDLYLVISNPNAGTSVTTGTLAGIRSGQGYPLDPEFTYLQTDTRLPANAMASGASLVNLDGQLVGVNLMTPRPGNATFALSVHHVSQFLQEAQRLDKATPAAIRRPLRLEDKKGVSSSPLGRVQLVSAGPDVVEALARGHPNRFQSLYSLMDGGRFGGVLVLNVGEESPAYKWGIHAGDVIVAIDDQNVSSVSHLHSIVSARKSGSRIEFIVLRRSAKDPIAFKTIRRQAIL